MTSATDAAAALAEVGIPKHDVEEMRAQLKATIAAHVSRGPNTKDGKPGEVVAHASHEQVAGFAAKLVSAEHERLAREWLVKQVAALP